MTAKKNLKRLIRERQARTGESYTTARRRLVGEQATITRPEVDVALVEFLALLGDHRRRSASVEATYRIWRHGDRLRQAREADIESLRGRGRSITSYSPAAADALDAETVELVHLWCQNDDFRYEVQGGREVGVLFIGGDSKWWWRRADRSVHSSEEDPTRTVQFKGLPFVLEPETLLDLVDFEVVGRSQVALRPTISAQATRRPPAHGQPVMSLYPLGVGADRYEMEVDADCGVILDVKAVRNDQVIQTITAQMINFDSKIPPETFVPERPETDD